MVAKALFLLLFVLVPAQASPLATRPCAAPSVGERPVEVDPVSHSYADLKSKFWTLYNSGRRLPNRAFRNPESGTYFASTSSGPVEIAPSFLSNLKVHVELALERGYADFLFYSDMGHGHLLLPAAEADDLTRNGRQKLEAALESKNLKVLYHTAELLKMRESMTSPLPQDPWMAWRYFSRNFLADNETGESLAVLFASGAPYNTVRSIDGYKEAGSIRLSASKDGCFSFQHNGETLYFDISFRP